MKRITFKETDVLETLTNFYPKPIAYNGQPFNFEAINDRIFEILLFQIFKARIEIKDYRLLNKFDNIYLMQGVGERGRDCILTKNGNNYGLIQCKKLNHNLTKTEFQKEILKFILHYTIDNSLIYDKDNFTYFIATSKGFSESTIKYISQINSNYTSEEIMNICRMVIKANKSLNNIDLGKEEAIIKEVLSKIIVKVITPADLTQNLYEHESLIKNFFRVLTVTDNTLLEGIIEKYLKPLLNSFYKKNDKEAIDFEYRFKEYLQRAYSYYSSSKTLVFGNQQKKLEDFYYPLTLVETSETSPEKELTYHTTTFSTDFLPVFKKIIIIDNGGMGKSTIMKWLFLSVIKQNFGIPIFIELRKLKDGKTILQEIVQELNPIDENIETNLISKLIGAGGFIFFLDGFDEVAENEKERVTTNLQNFISKSSNNLFIMTSRPETAITTFSDFKEFKVKKLTNQEAFELIKKIGSNSEKSLRLIKKLNENSNSNLAEFLQSPLLVSLLYKKFEHRENIPLQLQEFYFDVFEALFQDHDLTKGDSYTRGKKSKLSFTEFFSVLRELGYYTFKIGEIEYNDAVLNKYLNEISKRLPNIHFNANNFIEDLVKNVPLFNKEGLQYKWAHKSFQEYFTAEFICRDSKEKQIDILKSMRHSRSPNKYSFVLSLCYDIDYKPFRNAIILPILEEFIKHCELWNTNFSHLGSKFDKQMALRRSLTFNWSYLICNENDTAFYKKTFELIKQINNKKIDLNKIKLPNFISADFEIKLISFTKHTGCIIASNKSDLLELFVNKNLPFLNNTEEEFKSISKNTNIKLKSVKKYIEIGPNTLNESNDNKSAIKYYNKFLLQHLHQYRRYYLDYEKCILFIENAKSEDNKYNKEDYFSGF